MRRRVVWCSLMLLAGAFSTFTALADCRPKYLQAEAASSDDNSWMSGGSMGFGLATLAVPPATAGWIMVNVVKLGITAFQLDGMMTEHDLHGMVELMDQAEKGDGPRLRRLLDVVQVEHPGVTLEQLAREIIQWNRGEVLCKNGDLVGQVALAYSLGVSEAVVRDYWDSYQARFMSREQVQWIRESNSNLTELERMK